MGKTTMIDTGYIQEKAKEVKQTSKTVVFYFLPWVWQKITNKAKNAGATSSQCATNVLKVMTYIPSHVLKWIKGMYMFHVKMVEESTAITNIAMMVISTVCACAITLLITMVTHADNPVPLDPFLFATLISQGVWFAVIGIHATYRTFLRERDTIVKELSDD